MRLDCVGLPSTARAKLLPLSRWQDNAASRRGTSVVAGHTFIDLFAGIGGFHFGLTSHGARCVYANEWDKYAAKTYRKWTGHEDVSEEDIRTVDPASIPDHDILCGGFPCQPFSLAGVSKKNSLGRKHGFEDVHQGNLFFAIQAIAGEKRPKVLFLENVKNLKSHDRRNTWDVIRGTIESDLGYRLHDSIIDAAGWVPQHRERIFLVAFDLDHFTEEEAGAFRFPSPPPGDVPVLRDILDPRPDKSLMISDRLWEYLQEYAAKHRAKGNGFGFGIADPKGVTRTMSARYYKDGSEILIKQRGWRNPRRLSFNEAAKLMGFDATFSNPAGHGEQFPIVNSLSQSYRQFGNSVSPKVTAAIAGEIFKVLDAKSAAAPLSSARGGKARTAK